MSFESDSFSAEISISGLDKNALLSSFDNYPDFKRGLQAASVLILPTHLGPEHQGPVFPATTHEVFHRLRDELDGDVIVDAAIRDEDYTEYRYRSDAIILPVLFVAKAVLLPLVIGVLANYISDCVKNRGKRRGDSTVESEIHLVDEKKGTQSCFKYNGPAETFERVALRMLEDAEPTDESLEL